MTLTKKNGFLLNKPKNNDNQIEGNVIDLSNVPKVETKTNVRPKTAFKAESDRIFRESIHGALRTGHLTTHVKL